MLDLLFQCQLFTNHNENYYRSAMCKFCCCGDTFCVKLYQMLNVILQSTSVNVTAKEIAGNVSLL